MYLELWHRQDGRWDSVRTTLPGEPIRIRASELLPVVGPASPDEAVTAEILPSADGSAALVLGDGAARAVLDGQRVLARLARMRNRSVLRLNGSPYLLRVLSSASQAPGRCPLDGTAFGPGEARTCANGCRICASCFEALAAIACPVCSRPFGDGRGPDADFHPRAFFEEEEHD
jgi:hypothetical protein